MTDLIKCRRHERPDQPETDEKSKTVTRRLLTLTIALLALNAGSAQAKTASKHPDPVATRAAVTSAALRDAYRWWKSTPSCSVTVTYERLDTWWAVAADVPLCSVVVNINLDTLSIFENMAHPTWPDLPVWETDWHVYCASVITEVGTLLGTPLPADYNDEHLYAFCGNQG